jgi:membrane protein
MPLRRVAVPALIVAAGLELLKTVGRAFVQRVDPTHQAVPGTVGLLISLNTINPLILYAAALTATSTTGDVTDLSGQAGSRRAARDQSNGTAEPTVVPDTNSAGEDTSDHPPPAQE